MFALCTLAQLLRIQLSVNEQVFNVFFVCTMNTTECTVLHNRVCDCVQQGLQKFTDVCTLMYSRLYSNVQQSTMSYSRLKRDLTGKNSVLRQTDRRTERQVRLLSCPFAAKISM